MSRSARPAPIAGRTTSTARWAAGMNGRGAQMYVVAVSGSGFAQSRCQSVAAALLARPRWTSKLATPTVAQSIAQWAHGHRGATAPQHAEAAHSNARDRSLLMHLAVVLDASPPKRPNLANRSVAQATASFPSGAHGATAMRLAVGAHACAAAQLLRQWCAVVSAAPLALKLARATNSRAR